MNILKFSQSLRSGIAFFAAWAFILVVTVFVMHILRKRHSANATGYFEEFIGQLKLDSNLRTALNSTELALRKNKKLKKILRRASIKSLRYKAGRQDVKRGLIHIEKRLKCWPLRVLHQVALAEENEKISANTFSILTEIIDHWNNEGKALEREIFSQLVKLFFVKDIFLGINLAIYFCTKTDFVLQLAVLLNFIGFIAITFSVGELMTLLEAVPNEKDLEFIIWQLVLISKLERMDLNRALKESYKAAGPVIKKEVKEMLEMIKGGANIMAAQLSFTKNYENKNVILCLTRLLENQGKTGDKLAFEMSFAFRDYFEEMSLKNVERRNKKSETNASAVRLSYQLLGSLGIMLCFIQLILSLLGPNSPV